jgi:nicotinamidase-related amidase
VAFNFVPSGTVEVPDMPYEKEVILPADDTAIIVVDMQNDFVKPDGSLRVPAAAETVKNIQDLLASARKSGLPVVCAQDTQVEGDPDLSNGVDSLRIKLSGSLYGPGLLRR